MLSANDEVVMAYVWRHVRRVYPTGLRGVID